MMPIFQQHLINDGEHLIVEQGRKQLNILPKGVTPRKHIEKVERMVDHYAMKEVVAVRFKNGHIAKIDLLMDRPMPITADALQTFQATCLMVFDL